MQFSFEAKNLELSQDPDALGTSHCNSAHCSTVYTIQQCTLFNSAHYSAVHTIQQCTLFFLHVQDICFGLTCVCERERFL